MLEWCDTAKKINLGLRILGKYIGIESFPVIIVKYQVFGIIFCQFD